MFASLFDTVIVQPVFNLLVLIYGLLPGHNFGLAIILFTILVRFLMWPLVKKQLHHAKAMRELQPELKRIKKAAKGDRQKESLLMMELYKEREINPLAGLGLILVQIPIFLGLYSGLNRVVTNKQQIIDFSYPFVRNLSWIKELGADLSKFDNTLFGLVDLTRPALGKQGNIYWAAMLLVAASAIIQYYQSKQLTPSDKDGRKLRDILRDAGTGKESDQTEVNAAIGQSMRFLLPAMIFIFTVNIASALSLYWLVSGIVAYLQQQRVLGNEEQAAEAVADTATSTVIEGEVISTNTKKKTKKSAHKKKRRR